MLIVVDRASIIVGLKYFILFLLRASEILVINEKARKEEKFL